MTAGDVRRALLHGTTSELIEERLELVKEGSFRQARAISACACAGDSTLGEEKLSWDGLSGGGEEISLDRLLRGRIFYPERIYYNTGCGQRKRCHDMGRHSTSTALRACEACVCWTAYIGISATRCTVAPLNYDITK